MDKKVIDIMLNNIMLEKAIMKLYPDLEYVYMKPILNTIITTRQDLLIDEAKHLFKTHIPKIYGLIDWELYYEYCVISDYLIRFEEQTGLTGQKLLDELSKGEIGRDDMRELLDTLANSYYRDFVDLFKQHFSKEMIEENSVDTHRKYIEREKKLKRILTMI